MFHSVSGVSTSNAILLSPDIEMRDLYNYNILMNTKTLDITRTDKILQLGREATARMSKAQAISTDEEKGLAFYTSTEFVIEVLSYLIVNQNVELFLNWFIQQNEISWKLRLEIASYIATLVEKREIVKPTLIYQEK